MDEWIDGIHNDGSLSNPFPSFLIWVSKVSWTETWIRSTLATMTKDGCKTGCLLSVRPHRAMNTTRLLLSILLVTIFLAVGCATQTPDPLAGFQPDFNHQPAQAVDDDYHDYIRKLPQKREQFVIATDWLGDASSGQHAIVIQMGVNGSVWKHVLIYDKDNNRIKVIKYKTGGYRS